MNKLVILVILFIIALAFLGYFILSKESGSEGDTGFKGPSGAPSVNGPSGPPPKGNY